MRERAIRPYDRGWQAADLERDKRWIYHSSQTERDRLIDLAKTIEARCDGNPNRLLAMGADDFDLGPLAARLVELMGEIRDGAGLALYRGLPLDEVSPLGAAALYWGIGLHLGTPKSNNPEGDMIGHVVNTGGNYDNPNQRGYQTNVEMDYHCDQSDVVGLLCIRPAMTGGLSKVVSSRAVHATIKSRRPDLEAVLSQPFCWTKHAETDSGEIPFYESPVFNFVGDTLSTSFGPKHMIKGHRLAEAPDLTPLQAEAIDVMSELAPDSGQALYPFVRYEETDTQARMDPNVPRTPGQHEKVWTFGAHWRPIPQVVMKADFQVYDVAGDQFNFLLGYVF